MLVKHSIDKDFAMLLKSDHKVALNSIDKQYGRYVAVETLALDPHTLRETELEEVDILLLIKHVSQTEMATIIWCI